MTSKNGWRSLLVAAGLAAATVAVWWLWLGRDTEYRVDLVTGATSGPYEAGQVIGCAVSFIVLAVVGGLLAPPWYVVPAMTLPFTIAWSVNAATSDESGLWVVGAVLVLIGTAVGSALFGGGTWLVRRQRAH